MGDELLSFTDARLGLVAKVSDERHGVRSVPSTTGRESAKPIGRSLRSFAEDDRIVGDLDIESISGLDRKLSPSFARDDDLVLGADLDA
jgi:hypothetical protein